MCGNGSLHTAYRLLQDSIDGIRTSSHQSRPRAELLHARLLREERARVRRPAEGADAQAERHHRAGEGVRAARPRRRRLPDRAQVAVRAEGHAQAEVHRLQRRRERAWHVQGSRADGAQPAPAHRGVRDRLLRHRREGRLHLHPRRVLPRAGDARARDRGGLSGRLSSARTSSAAASTATSTCTAAPAPTKRAKRPRSSNRSRASARSRASSRRFPAVAGLYQCPTAVNNVETLCNVPLIVLNGPEWFVGARPGEERRPEAVLHQRPREASRACTKRRCTRRCAS